MKKLGTLVLTAALTGSLLTPALADQPELVIAPAPAAYPAVLSVNGTKLDTSALPAGQGLPLRLIAEADHGSAMWFEEENTGSFYLDGCYITVNFADGSVTRNDELLEGITAQVVEGVTFLPAEVFAGLEGYAVDLHPEMDAGRIDITTPNNDPLVRLAYTVADAGGVGYGMKIDEEALSAYGIDSAAFTQVTGFFPMMVSPDTVVVGKLAQDGEETARAGLDAYRQQQEDTFSWYLSQNLPKVQDARTVVKDGYILFVIAGDADAAVAAFESGVDALKD